MIKLHITPSYFIIGEEAIHIRIAYILKCCNGLCDSVGQKFGMHVHILTTNSILVLHAKLAVWGGCWSGKEMMKVGTNCNKHHQ